MELKLVWGTAVIVNLKIVSYYITMQIELRV